MAEIDCAGRAVREINAEIRGAIELGDTSIRVKNPAARHNLGVAILKAADVKFDGSVGYYCGGLPRSCRRGSCGQRSDHGGNQPWSKDSGSPDLGKRAGAAA